MAESMAAVSLDLTAGGTSVTVEQWYYGLIGQIGRQLSQQGLKLDEDALEDYWFGHERIGPLQRWFAALRELVLSQCASSFVVFIDEIDVVRSLPFPTDEFFAAIRECYNRRAQDPWFNRLTFCLLGKATPGSYPEIF